MNSIWCICLVTLCLVNPAFAVCDEPDTPSDEEDCDEDGFTVGDGDCDDEDAGIHPGVDEICDDDVDNNCDSVVNEGCAEPIEEGQLMGGSTCSQSVAGLFWVMPIVFLGRLRR